MIFALRRVPALDGQTFEAEPRARCAEQAAALCPVPAERKHVGASEVKPITISDFRHKFN